MERSYIAYILDGSGSMHSKKQAAVDGYTEKCQTIQEEAVISANSGVHTRVGLWTFNTSVREVFANKDPQEVDQLTNENYTTSGGTALYDAIDTVVKWFEEHTDVENEGNTYLIELITDGMENSSKCDKLALAAKLERYQSSGRWTLAITGADGFDLKEFAQNIHVPIGNVATYDANTAEGHRHASRETSGKMRGYMRSRAKGEKFSSAFHSDVQGQSVDYANLRPMATVEDALERASSQLGKAKSDISLDELVAQALNLVQQLPVEPPEQEVRDTAHKWLSE